MALIVIWIEQQVQTALRTKTLSNDLRLCIDLEKPQKVRQESNFIPAFNSDLD